MNGEEPEFAEGFADLHTRNCQEILVGEGFRLDDAKLAMDIACNIRRSGPVELQGGIPSHAQKNAVDH